MAGVDIEKYLSYKVNETNGLTADRFVEGVTDSGTISKVREVQEVSGANVKCAGVSKAAYEDDDIAAVAGEGSVVWVDGDGSIDPNDDVTNDADGKATKVLTNATVVHYWVHGTAEEVNQSDNKVKVRLSFKRYYS